MAVAFRNNIAAEAFAFQYARHIAHFTAQLYLHSGQANMFPKQISANLSAFYRTVRYERACPRQSIHHTQLLCYQIRMWRFDSDTLM